MQLRHSAQKHVSVVNKKSWATTVQGGLYLSGHALKPGVREDGAVLVDVLVADVALVDVATNRMLFMRAEAAESFVRAAARLEPPGARP